jgi:predicted phosphodiesterase
VRYLVLSDIHANLTALDAVLDVARGRGFDEVLVLGDLVGYGAEPNEVIARVQELQPTAVIRGNHDKVAAGIDDPEEFNAVARSAVTWTIAALTPEHRQWLAELPRGPLAVSDLVEICHGTPYDEDAYVFDELDALRALESASRRLCLYGHTHVAVAFARTADALNVLGATGDAAAAALTLEPGTRYLVNPGSVGQPRDGDPRAGCALVDTDGPRIELWRIPYQVAAAQRKIVEAGLPDVLAKRLAVGR